ncbi:EAL domain-containing protein [Treponema sp.]|uniref:EAL domain-containing protein n=1 Tax=Treponema sp. TaxID=166 RepID=UPI003F0AD50E
MDFEEILSSKNICTVFQPIVSAETGDVFAYEALSRIDSSVYVGSIKSLFAVSADANLSCQFEKKCIKSALKTARALGLKRKLFLNINPNLLVEKEFMEEYIQKRLEKSGINHSEIVLEITGQKLLSPPKQLCDAVSYLKKQGLKISIDNIGESHAALNRIALLNPDFIKINKELVQSIHKDKVKKEIVRSLSTFCKNSGIKLIAVGVETEENLKAVMELDIPYTQGFFIGKPQQTFTKTSKNAFVKIISMQSKKSSGYVDEKKDSAKKHKSLHKENSKYETEGGKQESRPISKITRKGMTIPETMIISDVLALFDANPEIQILTIISKDSKVIGIIPRITLFKVLGTQYGFSIYSKKPISRLMLTEYLAVEFFEPVEIVASKATARAEEHLYDPIVIEKEGVYFGVVIFKDLIKIIVNVEVLERTQELNRTARKLMEHESLQRRDMKLAEIVQRSIYPQCAPSTEKWDCAFCFRPMSSVSGDVYDFYSDENGALKGLALFDVSGHGVGSGLVGILSKYLAKDIFFQNKETEMSDLVKTFNKRLIKEKSNVENYLTGILLRMQEDKIEYINAGHTDLLCIESDGSISVAGGKDGNFRGTFLGIEGLPETFETVDIPLKKDSVFILFTDCLTESRNLAGDELGIELLQKILARSPKQKSAQEILDYLIDVFEAYTEAVPLRDDLTLIVLRYKG